MKSRFAKRVDRSQSGIVQALRKMGAQVEVTNMGNDFPDLLCGMFWQWKLLEVKELDGHFSRGQLKFLRQALGPVDIVTSEHDAYLSIQGFRIITPEQQGSITEWLIRNPNQETIRVQKLLKLIGRPIEKE